MFREKLGFYFECNQSNIVVKKDMYDISNHKFNKDEISDVDYMNIDYQRILQKRWFDGRKQI